MNQTFVLIEIGGFESHVVVCLFSRLELRDEAVQQRIVLFFVEFLEGPSEPVDILEMLSFGLSSFLGAFFTWILLESILLDPNYGVWVEAILRELLLEYRAELKDVCGAF